MFALQGDRILLLYVAYENTPDSLIRGFYDAHLKHLCAYVVQDKNEAIGNLCCTVFASINSSLALFVNISEGRDRSCY